MLHRQQQNMDGSFFFSELAYIIASMEGMGNCSTRTVINRWCAMNERCTWSDAFSGKHYKWTVPMLRNAVVGS